MNIKEHTITTEELVCLFNKEISVALTKPTSEEFEKVLDKSKNQRFVPLEVAESVEKERDSLKRNVHLDVLQFFSNRKGFEKRYARLFELQKGGQE